MSAIPRNLSQLRLEVSPFGAARFVVLDGEGDIARFEHLRDASLFMAAKSVGDGEWFNTSEDDYPTGQVSTSPLGSGDVALTFGDMAKAHARLIAAAPDLLRALQTIVIYLAVHDEEGLIEHAEPMQAARAAIAKATGEQQ
jgi:hypothetical protein